MVGEQNTEIVAHSADHGRGERALLVKAFAPLGDPTLQPGR
jgi:hypothetical protein